MGYSKTFLLLGLIFAVVLLISSDVSEAAQTQENVQTDAVEEAKYGDHKHGHGHGHGHGHHGHGHGHGHGHPGHGAAGET
ncbi:glycine-rich protein DC7.1-like [Alnus glutinosa]|uniref:glycine-rich protein DC7.1-like n=1 Tax=Alnus glutinosa TaxID=3517 RepID=UPI002D794707|nr:glycine-rich protein DC7.1-like [Alnus glutinosa]